MHSAGEEVMVKTLQECCLACIARHMASISRLGNYLSRKHKQMLLERMCWHELLTPGNLPSVSYHLFSPTLQRINLSHSSQLDDQALDVLAKSGCLPTAVTIQDCPKITDKGITSLAKILRKVHQLKLKRLKHLTSEGLKSITSETLTYVNLRKSDGITDSGIVALVSNCPNIEKLNLCELHKLTDTAMAHLAKTLGSKLVELDISDMNLVTSTSMHALAEHCKNLRVASFESCVRLDGSGLVEMAERCSISSLGISFCYKVAPQQLEVLVSLLRARGILTNFEAMGIGISPLALEMLASTSCLTNLSLCGVPSVTDDTIEMITRTAGRLLIELDISNCLTLTDKSCSSIARHCKCVEVLGLRNLREVKGTELSEFFLDGRAKNFRVVTLSGTKNLPPSVVETIVTHCPILEVITMAGLKDITNDIAFSIAHHCPNIRQMSFRNCELTDTGVCEIAVHCSKIRMIALAGIHILTDKSIIALAENCPLIEELYISGCARITRQAVTYLKDCAVHRVFVNHSIPNAPFGLLMAKDLDTGEYTRVDDMDLPPISVNDSSFQSLK